MLKKRLIPCLLTRNGRIIQSIQFQHTNVIGNAITAVDFFNTWAVDEIIILDISEKEEFRSEFYEIVRGLSQRCFVPLTVGGWVRDVGEIRRLLSLGGDKVTINSEAVRSPGFLTEAARVFGRQCIVASIDVKINAHGGYEVFIDHGATPTGLDPVHWAMEAERFGAGEIFLTSIDRDGSRQGYDLELLGNVTRAVGIPVISFGGVGNWQHLVDGAEIGGAEAVSAANIFHFTEHSTKKAKEYMRDAGVDVRDTFFYKIRKPRKPIYDIRYCAQEYTGTRQALEPGGGQ